MAIKTKRRWRRLRATESIRRHDQCTACYNEAPLQSSGISGGWVAVTDQLDECVGKAASHNVGLTWRRRIKSKIA